LDEALWSSVHGENDRYTGTRLSAKGVASVDDENISWTFDDATRVIDGQQRLLIVTLAGIDQLTADQIQAVVDIRFGPGVVTIERS
jgi:hypothetical protein